MPIYGLYRLYALNQQDLATRQDLFFYAFWQDAMIKHLDLTALARYDLVDNSRLEWLEARYHWPTVDLALQWQLDSGHPTSDYGALPDRHLLQLVARYYF